MPDGALEADELLILATIRLLGGQHLDPKNASLKPHAASIEDLKGRYFLEHKEVSEFVPGKPAKSGKPGKAKEKKTLVLALTSKGRAALEGDPRSASIAAASFLSDLKRQAAEDRAAVLAALGKNETKSETVGNKEYSSLAKDLAALSAKIDALATRVAALDQPASGGSSATGVEEAFARYERRIETLSDWLKTSTAHAAATPGAHSPAPPAAPEQPSPQGKGAPSLRDAIRSAYQELCFFREFEDGVVELPRLYRKLQQTPPGPSAADFHAELKRLVSERKAELKILNEVHLAQEPQLGIRDGALYYYIYWPEAYESR